MSAKTRRGRKKKPADGPLIFLVAGEPSGDALGAPLMDSLKRATGGSVRFAGVGGEQMREAGLQSLFPIADLAVMGLMEVVPRIPRILGRMRQTARSIRELKPAAVVTIDSPDFSAGVWKRVRSSRIPLIHYVAPTVWAWRPGRVRKYARLLDHIMVLLPFEPPYFERAGLAATFVGHAVVNGGAGAGDGPAFRAEHGLAAEDPVICVMPGSRHGEIRRHMPIFREALLVVAAARPGVNIVMPTLPHLEATLMETSRDWPTRLTIVTGTAAKFDAMAASDVALAASGTVSLELAVAGVPMVTAYRVNPLTAEIVRKLVRVSYANLINLLLDRPAVPELIQQRCRADFLAADLLRLLDDENRRNDQREAAEAALSKLRPEGGDPSDRAAEMVLEIAARHGAQSKGKGQNVS